MPAFAEGTENAKPLTRLAGLLLILLLAYTVTQPFRQIYGLESRDALMAREMLENGLSLIPTALGHPYPDYPPLYFWLETVCSMPHGHVTPFSAALPSALCAVALVALTFFWGRALGAAIGWLSALILATMPSFWLTAGRASIDMLLALNVTAALYFFCLRDQRPGSGKGMAYMAASAVFMVLAFLTKGPIGIVLPAVAWGGYLLWERRWKALFTFGLFIVAVGLLCIGMEWAVVYRAGGSRLVDNVIRMQVTSRIGEKSNHPFFYYAICLLEMGGLWWVLMAAAAFRKGTKSASADPRPDTMREWVNRHARIRQAAAWAIGTLAVFTVASCKKARYILPLYPAVAVLIAAWIVRLTESGRLPASPLWRKGLTVATGGLLLVGTVFYLFFPKLVYVPLSALLIWIGVCIAGGWLVTRRLDTQWHTVGAVLLLLFTGLVGVNLLVTPPLSHRASGQDFVTTTESRVDPLLPVVVYGIAPDGDGVKYALHSSRRPSSIRFVNSEEALASIAPPYLFVMEIRGDSGLPRPLSPKSCHLVADGYLRSHHLAAYRVDLAGPRPDESKKEIR
jgi:4-amino-4-deoxy-L-arabinose transferase-like glycosyltransferase